MKCKKGYVVMALQSAAGYYMGTLDEDGCPNCKLSSGYCKKKSSAEELPLDRQGASENVFCNKNGDCFK